MFRKLLATAALAALATTTAFAQVPATGSPAPVKGANSQFRAKQILGSQIMIQGNTAVGTVDDLVFDEAGNLEYLVVENAGKLSTVPWEAAKFDLEKKMAVLPLTAAQYNVIPTYTTTTYPSYYTPAYRTQMYKFYNLTPRELRRIDRRNP